MYGWTRRPHVLSSLRRHTSCPQICWADALRLHAVVGWSAKLQIDVQDDDDDEDDDDNGILAGLGGDDDDDESSEEESDPEDEALLAQALKVFHCLRAQ